MTEQTALTLLEQQQAIQAQIAALGGVAVAGDDNLEQGDIGMPPRLRISQPNRPIKVGEVEVPAGAFVNTITGEIFQDGIEIVPLVFLSKTRVKWPIKFSSDNEPVCASDDGNVPASSSPQRKLTSPQIGPCSSCVSGNFSSDGDAPSCKMQRNFLVWLVESGEPVILTMQSTALSSARTLTSLAKMQGAAKTIVLATQKQEDSRGMWYVPAPTKGRKLEDVDLLAVLEARNELESLVIRADVDQGDGADADPHGGAAGEKPGDGGAIPFGETAAKVEPPF